MEKLQIIAFGRGRLIVAIGAEFETRPTSGAWLIVKRGATIRSWGTGNGVGELVVGGPTATTTLDALPLELAIPLGSIHEIFELSEDSTKGFKASIAKAEIKLLGGK